MLALRWLKSQKDLAPRFLGEFTALNGAGQGAAYVIGAIAGLVAVGALRGGQLLLGPLNVVFLGIGIMAVPECVRLLRQSPERLWRVTQGISLLLASVALAWGLLLLLIPPQVGSALLGESWQGARSVVFALAVAMAGSGAMTGAFAGLRSLAAAPRTLAVRLTLAPLTLAAAAGGAVLAGALGAAWGFAVVAWIGAILVWRQFGSALGEHQRAEETAPATAVEAPLAQSAIGTG
jgi:O-antigen/teichoic acid export membrane protein